MKKLLLSILMLTPAALFFPTQVLADPPIIAGGIANGSFEDGYNGWEFWVEYPTETRSTWGIAEDGQTINPGDSTYDYFSDTYNIQNSSGLAHTYSVIDGVDGDFVAYQLQTAIQTQHLYQDIYVCEDATDLTWSMEYHNHNSTFSSVVQYSAVEIRDRFNDEVLKTLFITKEGDPNEVSMNDMSADISEFQGQTVRLLVNHVVYAGFFDAAWDNFRIPSCEIIVSEVDSDGFETPADVSPIIVNKNKTLPLKAELYKDGELVTDNDLDTRPIVEVDFAMESGEEANYIPDSVLYNGQGTEGNYFVFSDGKWRFNFKTNGYTAKGEYTITMKSGDETEYTIIIPPTVTFIIE